MHKFILIPLLAVVAHGQATRVLKDHLGNPMVEIIIPDQTFPCAFHSCKVRFTARNISGLAISHVWVEGTLTWGSGYKEPFSLGPAPVLESNRWIPDLDVLAPGEAVDLIGDFFRQRDAAEGIRTIDVQLSHTFKSPQELEQAKKIEEDSAKAAKKIEEDSAKTMRQLKAGCVALYPRTIDKPIRDLTVREETQISFCKSTGWYSAQ
jgi:hypothetical protein